MNKAEAKKRVEKLKKEIAHHRYQYHVLNALEISEAALDSLKDELYKLEQEFPELITPDSPTQRVAGEPLDKFRKVEHEQRMLSLNDAFNQEDLEEWMKRMEKLSPGADWTYFADPKIDGLAISLIYQDGVLTTGVTRGNGFVGEDVTHNIRTIQTIPLRLREKAGVSLEGRIEVRGEVYMDFKDFDRINKQRKKVGEEEYMNPRNTAAGSLRQLDPSLAADRNLKFFAYAMIQDLGQTARSDERDLLHALGFQVTTDSRVCTTAKEIMAFYDAMMNVREQLAYQIDGMVVHVDNKALMKKLGVVGKAPRGAVAMKFPAEQATTVVEDIVVQVGRTGAQTPVAHLRPVQVAGTTVQRATLHNQDEIDRLDVRIGDTVIIEKAGDIIPDVVEVLPNLRNGKEKKYTIPKKCPACGEEVTRQEGEVAHYCHNLQCPARHREGLYHFVSKKGFEIEGLGPRIIDQLVDEGFVRTPADLFELTAEQLEPLEGFAELAAQNVVSAVKAAAQVPLHRLIFALGIRHVGEQTAVVLAEEFGSFKKLQKATSERLESIHDLGPAASKSITEYFGAKENQEMLEQLLNHLKIQNPTATKKSNILEGKSFLFTGSLESMTRDDAKKLVRENGGTAASSVTKKLDYLVAGEKAGSKLAKAEKFGVAVLSEKKFLSLFD